jgi:TPP-dependent pyruvate/acetoin dehydrogenase alpha subunit
MTPADALTAVPAHQRAAAYGIKGAVADGNDPQAVAEAVGLARAAIVEHGRPMLIEAMTHRLVGHYSGDLQAYRPPGELDAARLNDPLARLADKIADASVLADLGEAVGSDLADALAAARDVPFPTGLGARGSLYEQAAL